MLIVLVYVTGDVAICSSRYYFHNRRLLRRRKLSYYSKSVNAPRNDVLNRRWKLSNCSDFANAPRNDVSGGALISKTETCCWLERHCEEPSLMFVVLVYVTGDAAICS